MELATNIKEKFKELYQTDPIMVRSPGRINLIGEHTDYNDGFVFPAAIDKEIILGLNENTLNRIRLFAFDENETFEVEISLLKPSDCRWANYLLGVVNVILEKGHIVKGFDCVFGGNIPMGAGLSSSAALENALSFGLNHLFNLNIERDELALIGQKAENTYAGTQCGIMDQFASMNGKEKSALLLDCRSLEYKLFPVDLGDKDILLVDTKVKHELASTEYNDRRKNCENASEKIKSQFPRITNLRDVSHVMLESCKEDLSADEFKRSKYIIGEIQRTQEASGALNINDISRLGQLMYETHGGLSKLYNVSCEELDFLVAIAKESEYVLGSRMMGGGFGGCTINILPKEKISAFKDLINLRYKQKFGVLPEFYEVKITNGTGLM